MARARQVKNVFVHAILDGRDTAPDAGIRYLKRVQEHLDSNVSGRIATICGRYFAMDRDNRWDRIEKAFQLYTRAEGTRAQNPLEAVSSAYQQNQTDEFVQPIAITGGDGTPLTTVDNGDGIIFFNFRADRARQITRSFTDPEFSAFQRDPFPELCEFVCMTQYDEKFDLPVAYGPVHLDGILGEVISRHGLAQLRIAETEKYAHVTYFFNGGEERPFHLEDRCLIPSPRDVATYDLKPEMSALKVTEEVVKRIDRDQYSLIILNYANMDMVGHTGVIAAAVKACEVVDSCIDKVVTSIRARNGVLLITADHGNAEKMKSGNGGVHTAHTCNPVPFVLVDDSRKRVKLRSGILGDIAPTILDIMEIDKPEQMTGRSLIER
jgi:2,3-bisphosphoglycerate-independent phosphoglycerate mutase